MLTKISLGMIWLYQRYVSPNKGFSCAHRVAYGGTGCSGYAKHRIGEVGIFSAFPDIKKRLRECSAAAEKLRADRLANCVCQSRGPVLDGPDEDDYERGRREGAEQARREERNRRRRGERCGDACDCSVIGAEGCFYVPRIGSCLPFGDDAVRGCGGFGSRGGSKGCDIGDCDACDCGDIGSCS